MKKEIRVEQKVVVTENIVYIASDGTEFTRENDCIRHEESLIMTDKEEACRRLLINPMVEHHLTSCGDCSDDYSWYRIETESDFELVKSYYELWVDNYIEAPKNYPTVLCVAESSCSYDYAGFIYLEDMMAEAKDFFQKFNINVSFN